MRGFYDTPWDSNVQPALRAARWEDPSLGWWKELVSLPWEEGTLWAPNGFLPGPCLSLFIRQLVHFWGKDLSAFSHFLLDGRHNEGLCFQKQALLHCHGRREMGCETRETKRETCSPKFELEASVWTQARFYLTEQRMFPSSLSTENVRNHDQFSSSELCEHPD